MPADEQAALKTAMKWLEKRRRALLYPGWLNDLTDLILHERENAVEAARPKIEREARINALEWLKTRELIAQGWFNLKAELEAEIEQLKGGGK